MNKYPQSYTSARDMLQGRSRCKVAHNTNLEALPIDGQVVFGIRYHATVVARWHENGTLQLNTGGWKTSTTAIRIRGVLPPGVYLRVERGSWFLEDVRPGFLPSGSVYPDIDAKSRKRLSVPFQEGILVSPNRSLHGLDRIGAPTP